jgi:hypothetical protein
MNKYNVLYIMCLCAVSASCGSEESSGASAAGSKVVEMTASSPYLKLSPAQRLKLISVFVDRIMRTLFVAGSVYMFHCKVITHFIVTGEILPEDGIDSLISDEKFVEEFLEYHSILAAMAPEDCSDRKFSKEQLREMAYAGLAEQNENIKSGARSLNVLATLAESDCTRLAGLDPAKL